MPYAHITGWGMSVPETILTNDDLAKFVDTNDAWIRDRTGIAERRIAKDGQTTSSLGVEAALKALKVANLRPTELDLIICSTSTPDFIFPATACIIQDQIGATKAGAFDLLAACSGSVRVDAGAEVVQHGLLGVLDAGFERRDVALGAALVREKDGVHDRGHGNVFARLGLLAGGRLAGGLQEVPGLAATFVGLAVQEHRR